MKSLRTTAALLACVTVLAFATPASFARYIRPQLDEVPIAKLIENLEKLAAKAPKDAKVRLNLARAHAMAYASKAESAKVWTGKDAEGVWFGYEPKFVPFELSKTDDEAKNRQAQEQLAKAIERYQKVVVLDAKMLAGRLGLAWCLDQAKKRDDAIREYRSVITDGWAKEQELKSLPLGGHAITAEAAGYLIPLLDAEKDKVEIADLKDRVAKLTKLPRPITPVVVPLKNGLTARDMVNPRARVRFDADGSGLTAEWSWFTPDAGILVYDPNRKGKITSALQWFGNVTFWMFWDNGYDALKSLDDNGDGMLTGRELGGLAIWIDANGNGVCEPGEVKTLSELGIVSLSCQYEIDTTHPDAIPFSRSGATFRDGTIRTTYDVILQQATAQEEKKELSDLQSTWKLMRFEADGEPQEFPANLPYWVIKGDKVLYAGNELAGLSVDAATKPRSIDLHFRKAKRTDEGIFTIEGDTLRICVSKADGVKERPLDFKTEGMPSRRLLVFERQKPGSGDGTAGGPGFVGVQIRSDPDTAQISIVDTLPDSPARKAGLKKDDVIMKIGGETPTNLKSAVDLVRQAKSGSDLVIAIRRGDTDRDSTVRVGAMPFFLLD